MSWLSSYVSERYEFKDDDKIYYAILGNDIKLHCRRGERSLNSSEIMWTYNGQMIDVTFRKNGEYLQSYLINICSTATKKQDITLDIAT